MRKPIVGMSLAAGLLVCALACSVGCANTPQEETASFDEQVQETELTQEQKDALEAERRAQEEAEAKAAREALVNEAYSKLNISEDYRSSFVHGDKPAEFQKYIVLHDTEGDTSASNVVNFWDGNGRLIAAHFIINKDGSIVQCVPLDNIAHHAGFGDNGHNEFYGVQDESRDDKLGTKPIGSWAKDYGMNSYSVGIEMVHVGGAGPYPEAQLIALDNLIAYIDAYYGFESQIIDHKAWRSGNSDTSKEFAPYFENYKAHRTHSGS